MANYGLHMWEGSAEGCYFEAGVEDPCSGVPAFDTIGIYTEGDEILVDGNKSQYAHFIFSGTNNIVASNNHMRGATTIIDYCYSVTLSGNHFEGLKYAAGEHPSNVGIVDSSVNVDISGNTFFNYGTSLVFHWNSYNNEFTIVGNQFSGSDGILMNGPWDKTSFRLEGFVISGNEMTNKWTSESSPRINLGGFGYDAEVSHGVISNNSIANNFEPESLITITNRENSSDGGVRISDNTLHGTGSPRPTAITIYAEVGFGEGVGQNYVISNNDCAGTEGIVIWGGQSAQITDNIFPQPIGTDEYYADQVIGQIVAWGQDFALVKNNHISIGNKTNSRYGETAVIRVNANKGVISGNTIEGHIITDEWESTVIDTAIRLQNGAYTITDNHYLGVGERWAATKDRLCNGLVVTGADSVVGTNGMNMDFSGATNVTYLDSKEIMASKEGTIGVTGGALRVPFRQNAKIISVSAMVDTAPTGASLIVDLIDSAGTTMFTTQPNRPTILATQNMSDEEVPDVTDVDANSYVIVQVDQIGSTEPGQDLTVLIRWHPRFECEPEE